MSPPELHAPGARTDTGVRFRLPAIKMVRDGSVPMVLDIRGSDTLCDAKIGMSTFIHIRSAKFPILPGEREELVNDGMYGKALAEYLQAKLRDRGYDAPFVCCEDWGWWVELKGAPFAFGVCVYSGQEEDDPVDLVCTDGAIKSRTWSWKRLRFVDTSPWVEKLHEDLLAVFKADEDVQIVGISEEFPL